MLTTLSKLEYLDETKAQIKTALNQFNAGITDEDTFRSYVDKIKGIYNNWPKVTGTGTELSLTPTKKAKMNIDLKGNTSQVSLPSGYTAVDYIESSGTQYIDTGYKPNQDTKVETEFLFNKNYNERNIIHYGTRENGDKKSFMLWSIYTNENIQYTFDTKVINTPATILANGFNKIVHDKTGLVLNGTKVFTNPTISTWSATLNLLIFTGRVYDGGQVDSRMASQKLKYFRIYDNNVLVREFIPCYRNSDSVVGLYDLVNGVFYTNQGTGAFTYGSVTSFPNPDYPQNIQVVKGNNTVKVSGKNLFDVNSTMISNSLATSGVTTTINQDGTISTSGTNTVGYRNMKWEVTLPAGTYYFCGCPSGGSTNGYSTLLEAGGSGIFDTGSGNTFTLSQQTTINFYPIRVGSETINFNGLVFKPMIAKVLVNYNDYEPYTETNYPINLGSIELCKIDTYQDYIYKSNDKWYKKAYIKKVVLDGNERQWAYYTSSSLRVYALRTDLNNIDYKAELGLICFANYYQGKGQVESFNDLYNLENNSITFRTDYTQLAIRNDGIENLLDFVTWLSTHNVSLYYVLATPTDIEITDTTLISQLEALYNAFSYETTTNISQTNADLPFIISASALKGGN